MFTNNMASTCSNSTRSLPLGKKNRCWISLKRCDLPEEERKRKETLKDFHFASDVSSQDLQQQLYNELNLDKCFILKMRNHRGSLVPINGNMQPSSKNYPYTLEVTRIHQNVNVSPKTVTLPEYHEALDATLLKIKDRIKNLESAMPELEQTHKGRVEQDMVDIGRKLTFLNKRFNDAETSNWKGMFKKNPMW